MKKMCIFLSLLLMFNSYALASGVEQETYALSNTVTVISNHTEFLSEGYYVNICVEEFSSSTETRATTSTKTGRKTYTIYQDSEAVAKFILTGVFTYDGTTSSCTSATYSTSIIDDSWKFTNTSASKSGNVATGNFTAKHYVLFIATKTITDSFTLTCNKSGTLS